MKWGFILVLALAIPILFWVALIWAGVFIRPYLLIRDMLRKRIRVWETAGRLVRTAVIIFVPVGVYAFAIWFFLGNFGWQVALAIALALPIIIFGTVLVWAAVVSGLAQVAHDALRRRVTAPRRREARAA